jgi:hypothetical protein
LALLSVRKTKEEVDIEKKPVESSETIA